MCSRFRDRRRRAVPSDYRIEELEGRALLSITAQAFTQNLLESVPKGSEAALVGWVQPTEYQGFALVGCTHPTTVRRGFWDRLLETRPRRSI